MKKKNYRVSWIENHSALVSAKNEEDAEEKAMSLEEENTMEGIKITELRVEE